MSGGHDDAPVTRIDVGEQHVRDGGTGVRIETAVAPPQPRSTLPGHYRTFVGRLDDLEAIEECFRDPEEGCCLLLVGEPGVGKSHLAHAYGVGHHERYPGGTFWVPFNADPVVHLATSVLPSAATPLSGTAMAERARLALATIRRPTLLLYDNVTAEEELNAWLPSPVLPVHVLVTTTSQNWAADHRTHYVARLSDSDAHAIVAHLVGKRAAAEYGAALVSRAAGVAVQLKVDAGAVRDASRHGRRASLGPGVRGATAASFEDAFSKLNADSRLAARVVAMFNEAEIPLEPVATLLETEGWAEDRVQNAVDAIVDRSVVERDASSLRMHSLMAEFLRAKSNPELSASLFARHLDAFVAAARAFADGPRDLRERARFLAYRPSLSTWQAISMRPGVADTVGRALLEAGRFQQAMSWFERAVDEAKKADVHGRVDHASLGRSLHNVGYCLSRVGKFDDARPWFERAVDEAKKADVHGRVDHASLGASLHQVGYCLASVGKFDNARPWFERAVDEAKQGDVHGRVDHESLGKNLYQVGDCLSSVGKFDDARPWFERAVDEAKQGDVHGRVDHESLGTSLHQVGYCLAGVEKFDEARPWFERAVDEAKQGDVHGRVDHEILGTSLHQVGYCLWRVEKFDEARPWFERAVDEAKQGDVHGRVDHARLGKSSYQVGYCLASVGKFDEARPWFERAVDEAKQGDVHGRVDHTSLGKSFHQVGRCLSSVGKFDDARFWFERAVDEKKQGDVHGRVDAASLQRSIDALGSK